MEEGSGVEVEPYKEIVSHNIHNVIDDRRRQTDASLSHKRDRTKYGRLKTNTCAPLVNTA